MTVSPARAVELSLLLVCIRLIRLSECAVLRMRKTN